MVMESWLSQNSPAAQKALSTEASTSNRTAAAIRRWLLSHYRMGLRLSSLLLALLHELHDVAGGGRVVILIGDNEVAAWIED